MYCSPEKLKNNVDSHTPPSESLIQEVWDRALNFKLKIFDLVTRVQVLLQGAHFWSHWPRASLDGHEDWG